MTLKIDAQKAKERIEVFLAEVEELLKLSYNEGKEKDYGLDTRIRNFVKMAFSDGNDKIKSYSGFFMAIGGHEETAEEKQRDYLNGLKRSKRHLTAWKEEVEVYIDTQQGTNKVEKISSEIEKAGLETIRRKNVAESKFYGAVIELLDLQRNHIKDKEQITKSIINIEKEIADMKKMISEIYDSIT